ncbi:hypothetical protein NQ315_016110 [Exocentrus adspersus]|uniref:Tyr recombinase domain-containing protein n=1 Tax=Exocentrus adspersus TaxID=1586481 RepID=A0AAV8V7J2_9CUCU|nr:hypothetical protein NQ315_016110 [Exocentrus adspersus]
MTMAKIPNHIANFLNLPETLLYYYTGHRFRRTSATLLVHGGGDSIQLKRHGGWKSSTVAEGYIDSDMNDKNETSKNILRVREETGSSNNDQEHAPDDKYLFMKVALIIGISGACRKQELRNIKPSDIQDTGKNLIINIRDSKTKRQRSFVVSEYFYPN